MEYPDYGPEDSDLELLSDAKEDVGNPDEVPDGIPKRHFWRFIEKKASDDEEGWYF